MVPLCLKEEIRSLKMSNKCKYKVGFLGLQKKVTVKLLEWLKMAVVWFRGLERCPALSLMNYWSQKISILK